MVPLTHDPRETNSLRVRHDYTSKPARFAILSSCSTAQPQEPNLQSPRKRAVQSRSRPRSRYDKSCSTVSVHTHVSPVSATQPCLS